MCNNVFKRRLAFSFTVIISQLSTTVKKSHTKVLLYKRILNFKNNLYKLLHITISDQSMFT